MNSVTGYFRGLGQYIGDGWNRFWFEPSDVFDLCVMRILVGVTALIWQWSFAADLTTWFGPDGWLIDPVARGVLLDATGYDVSFLRFGTNPVTLWCMHILSSLVLIAFTVGFRSRISAVASLLVVLAYAHRALILAGPAEPVVTMLVLYLCIAPIGAYLSVDARLRSAAVERPVWTWWATLSRRLIQVHLVIVYLAMSLTALGSESWWHGEAIWWISAQPETRLVDLTFLRDQPILLNLWTHAVLVCTLMFVVCVWNEWLRPLMLVASILMWISLAAVTGNLALTAVMIVANLSFVSSDFWRRVCRRTELETVPSGAAT